MVVAAHSMGNMMLDGALRDQTLADSLAVSPLRTVAYLAPDVDETYFADSLVAVARRSASRQVLYGSRNDRLLQISSVIHGAPRAGQLARKTPWSSDLEVLDVTDARVSGNWWIRHFGTNHAFRRRPDAVSDFFGLVLRDLPADCRAVSNAWVRDAGGLWRLQRAAASESASAATNTSSQAPTDTDSIPRTAVVASGPDCSDSR
jgi:esterase/lipase superfamily enzyme